MFVFAMPKTGKKYESRANLSQLKLGNSLILISTLYLCQDGTTQWTCLKLQRYTFAYIKKIF